MSTSVRTVVTSCLRIETEAVTMDHHSLEAMQLPCSRTFWNSHDASLDPFDETLVVPTMASDPSLEACSSTFQHLFPSTGSTCDESTEDHQTMFKVDMTPSTHQQTNIIFDDNHGAAAEDQSSLATAQSYNCTSTHDAMNPPSDDQSSLFTWSLPSSPPHYHPPSGELGDHSQGQDMGHYDGGLFFGLEPGHGSENDQVPLVKAPQQGIGKERRSTSTKASWQSSTVPATISIDQSRRNTFHQDHQPLGSPCSFTKGGDQQPIGSTTDYNMATSFGPSSSHAVHGHEHNKSPSNASTHQQAGGDHMHRVAAPKRKRSKAPKHSTEVESQRMTHIAVERNRRKQMNEHLAALRALMPGSYVQKGDQASIVGGAIEFVKELEHLLVCLQSQKRRRAYSDLTSPRTPTSRLAMPNPDPQHNLMGQAPPFSFHSPQSSFVVGATPPTAALVVPGPGMRDDAATATATATGAGAGAVAVGEAKSEVASVEVRMVGAEQATVKVMAVRRSGQLLRTVVALESLALTVVHANITTVNHTVLYSFQALVGPLCRLNPHEIAAALHQTFGSGLHSLQF